MIVFNKKRIFWIRRNMDCDKFEIILRKENKKIFNYLLKILRNREDAEDILQETFIAFHKKMKTIDEPFHTAYLFRTAHNKALNLIKSRKKREKMTIPFENMDHLKDQHSEKKENVIVKEALKKLKPEQTLLIELQFYQNMSYKEIAHVLETTVSAVDSKLVRTKKKLKKIIEKKIIAQEKRQESVIYNRGEK